MRVVHAVFWAARAARRSRETKDGGKSSSMGRGDCPGALPLR